jgi:hypothetical protein
VVGVLILLFAADATGAIRCNLSSWYVEPEFRGHASPLVFMALKHKGVTYFNISPAGHTWSTIEAQGFARYCDGRFYALPALNRGRARVRAMSADGAAASRLPAHEHALLAAHAGYGCLSVVCEAPDGAHPFVFVPFRVRRGRIALPCMQLVYCRAVEEFVRFAGPLGRFLLKRGMPWVVLDANGPVPGLKGVYLTPRGPKYFKGPHKPQLGDLAWTELVLFGP